MIALALALCALILAAVPAFLFCTNLRLYTLPPLRSVPDSFRRVSVLIPARDEIASIANAIEAALACVEVEVEVVVLDDHSQDGTAAAVQRFVETDCRVRLLSGPDLPEGWCGKQYACSVLAEHASYDLLLFLDADVRLAPDGLARLVSFLHDSDADLVSGIPRQETGSLVEQMVIPLIHFVLLGFLPLGRMRRSGATAYGAGCGQLFLARRASYEKMGGHAAIRSTLHDGIYLPRAFRQAGFRTDLCDATEIARCRMYRGGGELWQGLAKNAVEGLGAASMIVPTTLLLVFGQVIPLPLLLLSLWMWPVAVLPAGAAVVCSYFPRIAGLVKFRQPPLGALLHPFAVVILLAIQWYALGAHILGYPRGWKGRAYSPQL